HAEVFCFLVEINIRGPLYSKNAFTHFHHIQIHFQYPVFTPDPFNHKSEIGFQPLSDKTAALPEKNILGHLLADGAASPDPSRLFLIILHSLADTLPVKSAMISKKLILRCNHRQPRVIRYFRSIHIVALEAMATHPTHQLGYGDGRVYPF